MSRKTLILREDQFNEICGTNTAYLDNPGDYTEDGLTRTKTGGAVSDSNGEKEYSDPLTTDDYAHELAPETLFALLFRNGGHGLWGHWGSGLRADVLDGFDNEFDSHDDEDDWDDEEYDNNDRVDENDPDEVRAEIEKLQSILDDLEKEDDEEKRLNEEIDPESEWEEELFYKCLSYLKKTEFGNNTNLLGDTLYEVIDQVKDDDRFNKFDFKKQVNIVIRETMKKIDYEYYWEEYSGQPLPKFDFLFESNHELEGNTYVMDLGDGKKLQEGNRELRFR